MTGKAPPGRGYAPATAAHSESVLRGFYDFHLEAGTGPIVNPFPLARGRRGRANAHHNPMEPYRRERSGRYRPRLAWRAPHHIPEQKFNELFAALGSHRDRALVAFWVSTGRASELLGVSCRDADPGQQLIAVIDACGPYRLQAYVVLLTTGIRPEEARALRWDHLDLDAGTVAVLRWDRAGGDTKTARSRRTLKLPEIALAALKERMAAQVADRLKAGEVWQDGGLVFTTTIGTMLDQHNIRRKFRQITKGAGLGTDWVPRELPPRRYSRHSRSTTTSPRCGVHDSMTSNVASGFSRVMTTSEMSATNRSPARPSPTGPARTARPAIVASPGHPASFPSSG